MLMHKHLIRPAILHASKQARPRSHQSAHVWLTLIKSCRSRISSRIPVLFLLNIQFPSN